jgi:type II secretion system protein C
MLSAQIRPNASAISAPLCVAAALACGIVADVAHNGWSLYRLTHSSAPRAQSIQSTAARRTLSLPSLIDGHLFGESPAAAAPGLQPGTVLPVADDYTLSGVVAMPDPTDGYAILGPKGAATRLYRAGTSVEGLAGSHLYQVFADHVVLEISGVFKILTLPKRLGDQLQEATAHGGLFAQSAGAAGSGPDKPPVFEETRPQVVSAVQTAFADFQAEQNYVNGHADGMLLHPTRMYQRRYGLQDGDVLTAVNGIEVKDTDALNALLSKNESQSVTLSYTRNGQQYTVGM